MVDDKKPPPETKAQEPQGAAAAPDLSHKAWDESYKPQAWNSTASGRLAIRTFSRGLLGAAFFTAGGMWARNLMNQGHHEDRALAKSLAYRSEKPFGQIIEERNPLQFIAKLIDTCAGKPIEATVNYMGGSGIRATHFKPTKYQETIGGEKVLGRSLGAESVFLTFDFFCASIGDAMGRDIASWFDPSVKQSWTDDKGKIQLPKALETVLKTTWRYVSYNGGEDWAVAIPYVYFVKMQRNLIDKYLSSGYGFESDLTLNASSLKMGTKGTPHRVAGSYTLEAILDYQSRFTFYNIGTLMYRELYDKVGCALAGKHVNLYGDPEAAPDPKQTLLGQAVDVAKWTLRSVIKGGIYMTPAVPFFSITRATQNRTRGVFVDPDKNAALAFVGNDNAPHFIRVFDMDAGQDGLNKHTPVFYTSFDKYANNGRGKLKEVGGMLDPQVALPTARDGFSPYEKRHNMMENAFSMIGGAGQRFSNKMSRFGDRIEQMVSLPGRPIKKMLGLTQMKNPRTGRWQEENLGRFAGQMANAAVSYTPYMYAKAEFAHLWDSGKMDLAAERLIDGLFAAKEKEVVAGAGELWSAFLHKPLADPKREKEAQRRILVDKTASDDFNQEDAQRIYREEVRQANKPPLSEEALKEARAPFEEAMQDIEKKQAKPNRASDIPWHQRIVKGHAESPDGVQAVSTRHAPKSHAEREEMRKVLEELTPPTSSIH